MNDYKFQLELQKVFQDNDKVRYYSNSFFDVDKRYRKHLVRLVKAGFKAQAAIQIIRQAAAFSLAFPDDLQEKYMYSVIEIVTRK